MIEALSGAPFDVRFISFDDIKQNPGVLTGVDVLLSVGDGDTAHTGGIWWEDAQVTAAIRRFVYQGGGFIGVGEPSGHQYQGHYLQLASLLGVEKETGFTLNYDKYNWEEHPDHFILADCGESVDFGEGKKGIYALEGATVLCQRGPGGAVKRQRVWSRTLRVCKRPAVQLPKRAPAVPQRPVGIAR